MPFLPQTDDEIVATLLNAEDLLAAGKTLSDVARQYEIDEQLLRRWQSEYADRVAEEKDRRAMSASARAEYDALTRYASTLVLAIMVFSLVAALVRGVFFGGEPLSLAVMAVLSMGAALAAYFHLQRGEFPGMGRGRPMHTIRRDSNPALFWFFFWLFAVLVPVGVTIFALAM